MIKLAMVTTVGIVAIVSPASAQEGPYAAGAVGYTFPETIDSSIGLEAGIKGGFSVLGAVGYEFTNVRAELEGSYRGSSVDEARAGGVSLPGDGDVSALSAMANVYFDPDLQLGRLQPYIGAGAGISRFKAEDVQAVGITGIGPISASETGFAYQFMAGAGWQVSDQVTLTAGYRYFATPGIGTSIAPVGNVEIDGLSLQSVEIGFRSHF